MRSWASWGMALVLLAGCAPGAKAPGAGTASPSSTFMGEADHAAVAAADTLLCVELRGRWDAQKHTCTVVSSLPKNVTVTTTVSYPEGTAADPVLGPGLRDYAHKFLGERADPRNAMTSGGANAGVSVLAGSHETKTLVSAEDWYYQQMPHPFEAITTATFDLAQRKQIQLADLLCPGTDPLTALPPLVRPYLRQASDGKNHSSGGAFALEQFEPGGKGYLDIDYRAWALDGDDLLLYLPASRGPAGMPPGWLTPRVPLTALRTILRGACAA